MTAIGEHLRITDEAICRNIASLSDQRALLSQNILSQLRNLVEGTAVRLHRGSSNPEYNYDSIEPGLAFVKSKAHLNFLGRFHKLLQISASHYTVDGDASERLMLKYYEYVHRIRTLLHDTCGIDVLGNLESFPVDLDLSLREYHEKISVRIEALRSTQPGKRRRDRYYIHKTRPFFVGGRIYYEVTFYRAINKVSKFDRIIAFTHIDITDKYSANLTLHSDAINVLGRSMPIVIISDWEVSIRPCEFDNFARLLGLGIDTRTDCLEYRYLMRRLTANSGNLIDLFDLSDHQYEALRNKATAGVHKPQLFPVLDKARQIVRAALPGHNIIRYLMLRMHNQILKAQYDRETCTQLSGLNLHCGCIQFDTMPLWTGQHGPISPSGRWNSRAGSHPDPNRPLTLANPQCPPVLCHHSSHGAYRPSSLASMASASPHSGTGVVTPQKGPILVIGATGNQGAHVARALLDEGWTVHALTRNAERPKAQALKSHGNHLVTGDMSNVSSLTKAINGVTGIFSVQNFWDLGLKEKVRLGSNVIQAAINTGDRPHIVYSSGLGAAQRQGVAAIDGKAILEKKLRHSGLPFTILRPGLFMDDFLGASLPFARPIQNLLDEHRLLVGRLFLATLRAVVPKKSQIPLTTLRDVGRMVTWALGNPEESPGQVFEVIGSSETAESLCALWMEATIPRIPGLRLGIRMGHPKMWALLGWLGQSKTPATSTPVVLSTFREWLNSTRARRYP